MFTLAGMNDQLSGLSPAQRDALRIAGSVVIAAGIFVLLIRKGNDWADFPLLLVVGIPCALFYGLGIGALRFGPADETRGEGLAAWRAVALVLGIVFVAATVSQLIETIGGDTNKSGWVFVIFLITAAAAWYAASAHGLPYGALLAGLAAIISWIALWDALVEPSATTVRWLFVVIGALLAAAAFAMHSSGRREGPELVTAAGVAGLAAGVTALFAVFGALLGSAVASAFGQEPDLSGGIQQRQEWDVFLLLLALVLIWYGARAAWRGPVYVGAAALLAFVISAGSDIASLVQGEEASTDVVGWPLLLLVLGGAALAAGLIGGRATPSRPDPPAAQASGPPPASP